MYAKNRQHSFTVIQYIKEVKQNLEIFLITYCYNLNKWIKVKIYLILEIKVKKKIVSNKILDRGPPSTLSKFALSINDFKHQLSIF